MLHAAAALPEAILIRPPTPLSTSISVVAKLPARRSVRSGIDG